MEKETKVDIIHKDVSKEDKDLKKLVTYLQNKQTEIFTKLKELETENLRLRYAVDNDEEAFKRYKNINTLIGKENKDLQDEVDRYEREREDIAEKIEYLYLEYFGD
jgi:peptidoglycan hydrolase CwlO-like protein